MKRLATIAFLSCLCAGSTLWPWTPAGAQSLEELELRQSERAEPKTRLLGFGFLGVLETAAGLNRDRPEVSSLLLLAPQLKVGPRLRLRLNLGLLWSYLARQENPWDLTDISLQLSHLGLYQERYSGILISGDARYYLPTSKASRDAGSYGQLRLVGRASRRLGPLYLALELNGQKYFHQHTSWETAEDPGSPAWIQSAGREDYIESNTSYGLGQTFIGTVSPLAGLDLSLVWSLYQSRHYQPDQAQSALYGSSYLEQPRQTGWSHSFRFVADATYALAALPLVQRPAVKKVLSPLYLSLGYNALAPQLQEGGRSLNPFNPRFAQAYLDLMVVH